MRIVCHTQRIQFVVQPLTAVVDAVELQYRQGSLTDVIANAMTSVLVHRCSQSVTWSCSADELVETVSAPAPG
jgi:hypothetical protein